jgi:hypothetical protein
MVTTQKEPKSISLPELPKGKEFEEYILAYFQSSGFYTERNIEEKDVLELDIVATEYSPGISDTRLIEVKSGNWGMSDIFKVRGWMDYLNMNNGMFITYKDKENAINDCHLRTSKDLEIELVATNIKNKKCPFTSGFTKGKNIEESDLSCWRYSFWLERAMSNKLIHENKSHPTAKRFSFLRSYQQEINNDIFFTQNRAKRVLGLYKTFQTYPNASARCGNEIEGDSFDEESFLLSKPLYKETYYDCEYNDIQISTMIEYKARVALLKNAVDFEFSGETAKQKGLTISALPKTFLDGVSELKTHKYFYKYPIFWQWFLWVFGGFILKDYVEEEYKILSKKTGIPTDEIPNALKAFDILFPTRSGWFIDLGANSNISALTMFSVPFRGIGAHYRTKIYADLPKLKLTGLYTRSDLAKWNNLAIKVLS